MRLGFSALFAVLSLMQGLAVYGLASPSSFANNEHRSADTCADPSLAQVYIVGYSPSASFHAYFPRVSFIFDAANNGTDWQLQGPAFLAWTAAQEFTIPLWELTSDTAPFDLILVSTESNTTRPAVNGYTLQGIVGYVYDSEKCGSVPLLGAFGETVGDHYYTTSAVEHNSIINSGWVDASPTSVFVLPIPTGFAWSS